MAGVQLLLMLAPGAGAEAGAGTGARLGASPGGGPLAGTGLSAGAGAGKSSDGRGGRGAAIGPWTVVKGGSGEARQNDPARTWKECTCLLFYQTQTHGNMGKQHRTSDGRIELGC